ncbi:MAG: Gfo/Idh/MocA family protein [Candidatus Hydrogenedentota bacterium]
MVKNRVNRRQFLERAALGAFCAAAPRVASAARVGPSDAVRVAVIGNGGMGSRHIEALAANPECRITALCDVAVSRYMRAIDIVEDIAGYKPPGFQDFRRVLDRDDVDAIFVATPDNWHPLMSILGCRAGKDVYVEKPACMTVEEGRAMVTAARRYGRVVQLGTQQRSMPVFQKAMNVVHSGRIGQVCTATAWVGTNGPLVGETVEDVPKGLDWDLWLGPAPWAPFSKERFGSWMAWHDYARGGELTNWGVHLMDILHWGIGQDKPLSVQAIGGCYRGNAGAQNYETIEAIFEYPGCNVTWEQRHTNLPGGKSYGIRFHGTEGALYVDRGTFLVKPEGAGIPEFIGEPEKSWANTDHHNNFFHCVRTRERPVADIEQGFRSTLAPLIAGIALKTRRKLEWDGEAECFAGDEEANRHLHRAYRAPWRL